MTLKLIDLQSNIEEYVNLWKLCFPEDDIRFISEYTVGLIKKKAFVFGSYDNKKLLSMITVIPQKTYVDNTEICVDSGFVVGVATHPSYRGRGLSSDVMEYAFKYLKQNTNMSFLQLTTVIPAFYERLNFEEYYRRPIFQDSHKENILNINPEFINEEIIQKLYTCYMHKLKDGYFHKELEDIREIVARCDSILVSTDTNGEYTDFFLSEAEYDCVELSYMVRYTKQKKTLCESFDIY